MSSWSTWFSWGGNTPAGELPEIFPMAIGQDNFVAIDVESIYGKILTDVIERSHGIPEEQQSALWDNCLRSESSRGLITLLACAMTHRQDLFLVYDKTLNLLRCADSTEQAQIRADYSKSNKSSVGVFASFKHFVRADLVRFYSSLEYCTAATLWKSMKLSMAVQIKMNDLRSSTAINDSEAVTAQAAAMARALGQGKDVLTDAKDIIDTAKPAIDAAKQSSVFLNEKRAFYLGMPASYISGEQTGGIGSTGEGDTKATERGLKNYYSSVIEPVCNALFEVKLTYKSQDFRQIDQGLSALKTFELTSNELLGPGPKKVIIETLFDVDPDDNDVEDEPAVAPAPALTVTPGGVAPKVAAAPATGAY